MFVPSKKQAAKAGQGSQPLAKFVPSQPLAAFVKKRSGKKGKGPASPKTPTTPSTPGVKKVKIVLANNQAQGFKEHLMNVRNSPQVPHNPLLRPTKGLLKTPTTPASLIVTRPLGKSGGTPPTGKKEKRRRSNAADFFTQ